MKISLKTELIIKTWLTWIALIALLIFLGVVLWDAVELSRKGV